MELGKVIVVLGFSSFDENAVDDISKEGAQIVDK